MLLAVFCRGASATGDGPRALRFEGTEAEVTRARLPITSVSRHAKTPAHLCSRASLHIQACCLQLSEGHAGKSGQDGAVVRVWKEGQLLRRSNSVVTTMCMANCNPMKVTPLTQRLCVHVRCRGVCHNYACSVDWIVRRRRISCTCVLPTPPPPRCHRATNGRPPDPC